MPASLDQLTKDWTKKRSWPPLQVPLTVRCVQALWNEGIDTVEKAKALTFSELLRWPNISHRSAARICQAFKIPIVKAPTELQIQRIRELSEKIASRIKSEAAARGIALTEDDITAFTDSIMEAVQGGSYRERAEQFARNHAKRHGYYEIANLGPTRPELIKLANGSRR